MTCNTAPKSSKLNKSLLGLGGAGRLAGTPALNVFPFDGKFSLGPLTESMADYWLMKHPYRNAGDVSNQTAVDWDLSSCWTA